RQKILFIPIGLAFHLVSNIWQDNKILFFELIKRDNYPERRSSVLSTEKIRKKEKTGCILWALACITLFTGCSTRRNTIATRAYHELTTRYNIYFNAEEAYHEILKER